jgi:hypothetical protein
MADEEVCTATIHMLRECDAPTVQAAVDGFLSSPRCVQANTRRGYTGVLDRPLIELGAVLSGGSPTSTRSPGNFRGCGESGLRPPGTAIAPRSRRGYPGAATNRRPAPACQPAARGAGKPQRHPSAASLGERARPSATYRSGRRRLADAERNSSAYQRGPRSQHRPPRPGRPLRSDPL